MQIPYELKQTTYEIPVLKKTITLETIANLDAAVDLLFKHLENISDSKESERLLNEHAPYFGCLWPSACVLAGELAKRFAKHLDKHLSHAPSSESLRVLELGCGLALPSFVSASFGHSTLATDFNASVPVFLEKNLELNPWAKLHLKYQSFRWNDESTFKALENFKPDLIVGSDLLYEKEQPEQLSQALKNLAPRSTTILITDPRRPYLNSFCDEMKRQGFHLKQTAVYFHQTVLELLEFSNH